MRFAVCTTKFDFFRLLLRTKKPIINKNIKQNKTA